MSSVVKTVTPFINKALLLEALDAVGCAYSVIGNEIVTDRIDARGNQKFVLLNGRYAFMHYSHADSAYSWNQLNVKEINTIGGFLKTVEQQYNAIYQQKLVELERRRLEALAETERKRLEEEALRLERERREYVEKQKAAIIAKAKEKGYSVREEQVKGKVKLVLVRNIY
jgi:hypothetical protein